MVAGIRVNAQAMESELQSKTAAEQEYLQHMVDELKALAPRSDEENELASSRTLMMASEKIAADLSEATDALTGAEVRAPLAFEVTVGVVVVMKSKLPSSRRRPWNDVVWEIRSMAASDESTWS